MEVKDGGELGTLPNDVSAAGSVQASNGYNACGEVTSGEGKVVENGCVMFLSGATP
jgi:hypothetical protein